MTWNIHGVHGGNPGFDLDRVIALIKRHDPDVVALQEIDEFEGGRDLRARHNRILKV